MKESANLNPPSLLERAVGSFPASISLETRLVQSHFGGNHSVAPVGEVPVGPGSSDDLGPGRIIPRGQTFGSGTASHDVATSKVGECVTAGAALITVGPTAAGLVSIGPSTTEHAIVTAPSVEVVVTPSSPQDIILRPAKDRVANGPAMDTIAAASAAKGILAVVAEDDVIARDSVDAVVPAQPTDDVVPIRAGEIVMRGRSYDRAPSDSQRGGGYVGTARARGRRVRPIWRRSCEREQDGDPCRAQERNEAVHSTLIRLQRRPEPLSICSVLAQGIKTDVSQLRSDLAMKFLKSGSLGSRPNTPSNRLNSGSTASGPQRKRSKLWREISGDSSDGPTWRRPGGSGRGLPYAPSSTRTLFMSAFAMEPLIPSSAAISWLCIPTAMYPRTLFSRSFMSHSEHPRVTL
jgi:hypothetical protein